MTMRHLIESMESALAEVEFFEAILAADDASLDEAFDADDVARLEALADLIGACEDGVLSEDDDDLMEGLRSWLLKKKKQFVRKLPPGAKMVFGKIVKGGKVLGQAAKATASGVQAGARGVQAGARKVVAAKRAVQGAAYRFTDAGKKARAASKRLSDTKGRKAGDAAWQKSQDTYKKHVKAGESHAFASSQAQAQKAKAKAGGGKPKLTKPAAAPSSETMPGTGARKKSKPAQAPAPAKKSAPRKRKTKMEDVFQDLDVIA
jgi:hypothetical protein